MGKLIKQIQHGLSKLSESSQELASGQKNRPRFYAKRVAPLDLPKNIRQGVNRDMKKLGCDIYASLSAVNVK